MKYFRKYELVGEVFDLKMQMLEPTTISGSNKPWSNFGSAISSLGDINQDGYNGA